MCDEVRMRAVVPYARHQRAEELPDARGEDGAGETCGSRPREALNVALTPRQKKKQKKQKTDALSYFSQDMSDSSCSGFTHRPLSRPSSSAEASSRATWTVKPPLGASYVML